MVKSGWGRGSKLPVETGGAAIHPGGGSPWGEKEERSRRDKSIIIGQDRKHPRKTGTGSFSCGGNSASGERLEKKKAGKENPEKKRKKYLC